MARQSKTPRMPIRLALSGVGAALLLAATVLVGLYLGSQTQERFEEIDTSWQAYTAEAERRGELLSRIRENLGYGGFIHNFKNYVLRKDPAYRTVLVEQLDQFGTTIDEYRESGASAAEREYLSMIEETIAAYEAKVPIADQAAREDWPPTQTDRLVKIDDTQAIAALAGLDEYWRDKRRETTETIAAAVTDGRSLVDTGFQFLGGLAFVAVTLYALFFVLQRELRQTIGLLSKELGERKAAEHVAKKFQRAVEQSPATIIITDTEGRIEYVNGKFCDLTGYEPEEVLDRTPRFLQSGDTPRETYLSLRQQLTRGEEWRGTFRNLKKNGDLYWANTTILPLRDDDGHITHFIGLGEDLTERRKARDQIHRAQKMEAVGLLASGVAHDFNNVLTTILGNVHLARMDAPKEGELAEELSQIEIAAKRARNLVGQVLAFARREPGEPQSIAVADVLNEVTRLMRATIPPNIEITCEVADPTLSICADPTRLHQVIMNLCSNAAEAIGAKDGRILLSAERHARADSVSEVCLSVTDDGPGIPEDVRPRIFDPFFTTKPPGKGTGLGLPVVANLVAEMNGQIRARNAKGGGAVFEVFVREAEPVSEEIAAPSHAAPGSASILLIDDETEVVTTCAKILRRLDYDVAAFTDPEAALRLFDEEPDRFALVMTDFVMPQMNGEQVCKAVRAKRPDCPIILYTAYQPGTLDTEALKPIRLLEKPVDPALFSQTVRSLIEDAAAA